MISTDPSGGQRADCHCHTLHSDGSLSTTALLDLAKAKNLTGLSITDHDTIAAYDVALPYARTLDIQMISGIEISCEEERISIHVLGFAFDLQNTALRSFCERLQNDRHQRNLKILERLQKLKLTITIEELQAQFPDSTLGRPHIAKLMVEKGYVRSPRQAFDRYLGDKGRCHVAGFQVAVEEAIELIHCAGGFAVLAHPHYYKRQKLVDKLLAMPFDGIEAYYGNLSLKQEQPWLDIAQKKGWIVTGGSDFHGAKKAFHSLGCSFTPADTFALFTERFASHGRSKDIVGSTGSVLLT